MDREIKDLKEFIAHRFDGCDHQLLALTDQVKLTNGRLREAERNIAVLQDRLYVSAGAVLVACVAWAVSLFR